jgi:hypothetical protein
VTLLGVPPRPLLICQKVRPNPRMQPTRNKPRAADAPPVRAPRCWSRVRKKCERRWCFGKIGGQTAISNSIFLFYFFLMCFMIAHST